MKDMDFLREAGNDEGYASTDVIPHTEPQENTQTVDITYEINKGKLVYSTGSTSPATTRRGTKVIRRQSPWWRGISTAGPNSKKATWP